MRSSQVAACTWPGSQGWADSTPSKDTNLVPVASEKSSSHFLSRIIVAGGHGDAGPQDGIIGGDSDGGDWEAVARMARPRDQVASLVLPQEWRMYTQACH